MSEVTIDDIVSLGSDSFVAGTNKTFRFFVLDQNGAPLGLLGATCSLKVFPVGQYDVVVLEKAGVITDTVTGTFEVTIEYDDTKDLSGIYDIQPHLIDFDGKEYIPCQGQWIILPLGQ